MNKKQSKISLFDKYLTVWVLICMGIGILVGKFVPSIPDELDSWTLAGISIPIAILIWIMIYPVMLKIDFKLVFNIKRNGKSLILTTIVNWLVKPFSMYGIAMLFFKVIFVSVIKVDYTQEQYIAGLILLAAAPCTAMVFVWSKLTNGDPNYTLAQVILNDTIMLFAFVPIVGLLLNASGVSLEWDTLLYSLLLFIGIPLTSAIVSRYFIIKYKTKEFLQEKVLKKFDAVTTIGLLLTLVIIFMSQSHNIISNPLDILLIMVPVLLQTTFTFVLIFIIGIFMKLPWNIIGPASTIGSSNFFELALATSVAMFGPNDPATLAVMVGIIVEVPIMLSFVSIVNRSKVRYSRRIKEKQKQPLTRR